MKPSSTGQRWRKAGRVSLWVAAALGVVFVLLVAAALLLLTTEGGARVAWRAAVQSVPGKLSGQVAGGTLDGGLVLRNVLYAENGMRIAVDRLETRWELLRDPLALHVLHARAGRVDLTLAERDGPPVQVPARLTLPVALQIDLVAVESLAIQRDGSTARVTGIRLHGSSNRVLHRLILDRATTAHGDISGKLVLNGAPPFAVSGGAVLTAAHAGQSYRVKAELAGTLTAPDIELHVGGAQLDAHAHIGLAPFAGQVLRSLQASVRGFDPSRVEPQWPQADLWAQVSLGPVDAKPAGKEIGLAGSVRLENRLPGALDRGRIPVAEARAELRLGPHRSVISVPEARLAGGALVTGSATLDGHGHGPLQLQVQGLDLREIHTSLIATSLTGTALAHLREKAQLILPIAKLEKLALQRELDRIGSARSPSP